MENTMNDTIDFAKAYWRETVRKSATFSWFEHPHAPPLRCSKVQSDLFRFGLKTDVANVGHLLQITVTDTKNNKLTLVWSVMRDEFAYDGQAEDNLRLSGWEPMPLSPKEAQ